MILKQFNKLKNYDLNELKNVMVLCFPSLSNRKIGQGTTNHNGRFKNTGHPEAKSMNMFHESFIQGLAHGQGHNDKKWFAIPTNLVDRGTNRRYYRRRKLSY